MEWYLEVIIMFHNTWRFQKRVKIFGKTYLGPDQDVGNYYSL